MTDEKRVRLVDLTKQIQNLKENLQKEGVTLEKKILVLKQMRDAQIELDEFILEIEEELLPLVSYESKEVEGYMYWKDKYISKNKVINMKKLTRLITGPVFLTMVDATEDSIRKAIPSKEKADEVIALVSEEQITEFDTIYIEHKEEK